MPIFVDARLPVVFATAGAAGPGDALLVEGEAAPPEGVPSARFDAGRPGHFAGCACCAPRGPVAEALRRLFLARARGVGPFFTRVVVAAGPAGEAAVRQAVTADIFLAGRYRLADPTPI